AHARRGIVRAATVNDKIVKRFSVGGLLNGYSHHRSVFKTGGRLFPEESAEIYSDRGILEGEPSTARNFRRLVHTVSLHQMLVSRNKSSQSVGITADRVVGMKSPELAKPLKRLVGAQGLEPWTR